MSLDWQAGLKPLICGWGRSTVAEGYSLAAQLPRLVDALTTTVGRAAV